MVVAHHILSCPDTVAAKKVFRDDLSLAAFQRQFSVWNSDVLSNKRLRFTRFLQAAADGTLFDRPNFDSPFQARKTSQPAMFDLLQASADDVDQIYQKLMAHFSDVALLAAAGDGLSFMRSIQAIAADAPRFHGQKPFVLPILGLNPHLEFHVVHAGWRNFRHYINIFGRMLNNWQMSQTDILVSQWNACRFEMSKLVRAHSEYFLELLRTPGAPDISRPGDFASGAEQNIDFRWAFSFLSDFGFLWLDMMQARRSKKIQKTMLLMREFLPFGRTTDANKTNYGYMTILFVYLNQALHPDLQKLYGSVQTLPTGSRSAAPGSEVGLDWFPEELNLFLKSNVQDHISRELINKRILDHEFLSTADAGLMDFVHQHRALAVGKMKKMDTDVAQIKALLRQTIGSTWAQATRANMDSEFGLDVRATVYRKPWETILRSMTTGSQGGDEHIYDYVSKHVKTYAPWHVWKQ